MIEFVAGLIVGAVLALAAVRWYIEITDKIVEKKFEELRRSGRVPR